MDLRTVKRVTAVAPIIMSLVSLAIVIEGHLEFGSHPPADEGWQAHIFQLLMLLAVPIILLYIAISWRSLKQALPVLAAQLFLWLLALGALRFFNL
jgi:multisubunit Na+/H+ antiporter MnhB subunit